jgi:hypothetical protein
LFGAIGAFGAVVYQEMHKPPEKDSIVFGYKIDPTNGGSRPLTDDCVLYVPPGVFVGHDALDNFVGDLPP